MSVYVAPALLWLIAGLAVIVMGFKLTMRFGPAAARTRSFFTVCSVYLTIVGVAMLAMLIHIWPAAVEKGHALAGSIFVGVWLALSIRYLVLNLRQWGKPLTDKELKQAVAGAIVGGISFGS